MAGALLIKTLVVILASVGAVGLVARVGLPAAAGYLQAGFGDRATRFATHRRER
jgi:CPA2 family monovalent cation:H+ antiporter-2